MKSKLFKYDFILVGVVAFLYFLLLCVKQHTFIFFSGDSGDWLAGSIWWMNVQPYGSPLYIALGHLINWIAPNHLVVAMTVGLSVIPASITVVTTYLICKKLTNYKIALVCSLVLLGSAVYLTQATVLEEFAISSMFVSLAFYFYLQDKKKLSVFMLALGSAVQIIVVLISGLWFLIHIKELKAWWKTFWIYVVFGLLPYAMVLVLMYLPSPRLLAGGLSLKSIDNYLGATGTFGSLSLFETPERLLNFIEVLSVSLGLAFVPIFLSLKGVFKQSKAILVALLTVLFVLYIYLTDSDPGTWHFLPIAYPLIMVFVALGLYKMGENHQRVIAAGACVLILVNGIFLNANVLSKQYPLAQRYEQEVRALPDGSYIVCNSGGQYGLDNYYLMASGKDIRPIFYGDIPNVSDFSTKWQYEYEKYIMDYLIGVRNVKPDLAQQQMVELVTKSVETTASPRYQAYQDWMRDKYGLQGSGTIQHVRWLLSEGENVYLVLPTVTPYWEHIFKTEVLNMDLAKIVGVNNETVE